MQYSATMNTAVPQVLGWDAIQTGWDQFRSDAKRRWDRIGEQQMNAIGGRRAILAARVKEAYGLTNEETEKQLVAWQSGLRKR